jgi:hypothetical protein
MFNKTSPRLLHADKHRRLGAALALSGALLVVVWLSVSASPRAPVADQPLAHAGPRLIQASTVVTLSPIKDNTLYEDSNGLLSNGAGQYLFVGRVNPTGGTLLRRGVIAFDIAGNIPPGVGILSARLRLHMSKTITDAQLVTLHRLQADWGEGTSDAAGDEGSGTTATTGDATWQHRFYSTTTWTTAGGDFVASPSATTTVDSTGFYVWGSTPQMLNDVQNWLVNPSTNYGWLLRGNESSEGTAKRFDSRENLTVDNQPVLIIEYVPASVFLPIVLRQ